MRIQKILFALFLSLSAGQAMAHEGHMHDFVTAAMHPIGGWDHLLAMLLVGMLARRYPTAQGIALPFSFVTVSLLAAALAPLSIASFPAGLLEAMILISVLALGALLALRRAVPWILLQVMTVSFAFAHGSAHGVELTGNTAYVLLGLGLSSAILHALGYAVSEKMNARFGWMIRGFGFSASVIGLSQLLARV